MEGLLKNSFCIAGFNGAAISPKPRSSGSSAAVGYGDWRIKAPANSSVHASICIAPAMRWWEKTLKSNMVEMNSSMDLVSSLLNADDRLVVVDFYSPGCGGCRTLHPKICQLAEFHPDAIFLKVNYDELRTMCKCLDVNVLPFFKMYRGVQGRVCSFSCTNSTIKKFKDAMAKHGVDRCSIGPTKGLDDAELQRLVSSGELSSDWSVPNPKNNTMEDLVLASMGIAEAKNRAFEMMKFEEDSLFV